MVTMISMQAACEQLGVSERSLRRFIASQQIEGHKIGRTYKFKQAAIDDFIDRRSSLALMGRKTPAKAVAQAKQRLAA